MTKPYSSPPTHLRSLRDRLTQVAERQGVVFGRLQRHVAMLVVAQFAAMLTDDNGTALLLAKGASSLELRRGIPDSRTSKDFDTVARRDIDSIHEQLADAGETGWEGLRGAGHAVLSAAVRPNYRDVRDRAAAVVAAICHVRPPTSHPKCRRAPGT